MGYGDNDLAVTVDKAKLLNTVKRNRSAHATLFTQATTDYRAAIKAELDQKIKQAETGDEVDLHFQAIKPEDHTADYDDVIGMLEFSKDEEIEIDHTQYRQWVKDEWGWKHSFNLAYASNSMALGKA